MNSTKRKLVVGSLGILAIAIIAFVAISFTGFLGGSEQTEISDNTPTNLENQAAQTLQPGDVDTHYYYFPPGEIETLTDEAFYTTWKTSNTSAGSSNANQITIPTTGSGYNYVVEWGDGTSDTGVTGNKTHTYSQPGTYQVRITGAFPRIYFNNTGDKLKLLSVDQWGSIEWKSMASAFYGASNLHVIATDAPDLSDVTNMSLMFAYASSFNESINHWDVSTVTDMNNLFTNAASFNQPLNNWNVSKVTNMASMFAYNPVFNQPLTNWNVSRVTNMASMFFEATVFNQPLNNWNVSSVTRMNTMFFKSAAFNQPLSSWNVGSATHMNGMFSGATSFNQSLGSWNVRNVITMESMLENAPLSVANYDALLAGWSTLPLQSGLTFHANISKYCNSATQRQSIITTRNWTINDGGLAASCGGVTPVTTDTTAPVLSSARISGKTLTMTYNEDLDENSEPSNSSFSVKKSNGTTYNVSSVRINDNKVTLNLSSDPGSASSLTLKYSVPTNNPIQDIAGNNAAALTNQSVSGNSSSNTSSSSGGGGGSTRSTSNTSTQTTNTTQPSTLNTSGMTNAQLLELIRALQIQLANIIAQRTGGSSSGGGTTIPVTTSATSGRTLTLGDSGTDVLALQRYLISKGYLLIDASAAQGNFGPLTQGALIRFQKDKGIFPAAGFYGPLTRTYINSHP